MPKPYPDELLYSVVARYVDYSRTRHIYSLKISLFGGESELNPFLPRGLYLGYLAHECPRHRQPADYVSLL